MILIVRKVFLQTVVLFLTAVLIASIPIWPSVTAVASNQTVRQRRTVILDAGHGGADGGAVTADGVAESGINLAISLQLCEMFHLFGIAPVLTRKDSHSLASASDTSLHQQKVSDTQNRVKLINGYTDAVLISIHQNTLPGHSEVHGAQVFSNHLTESYAIATQLQAALNQTINPSKPKEAKTIGNNVYIMNHAECPAVLVECGFLSNTAEAELLQTPSYQTKLALLIACGYMQYEG